jgi:hypothetical protein
LQHGVELNGLQQFSVPQQVSPELQQCVPKAGPESEQHCSLLSQQIVPQQYSMVGSQQISAL